MRRITGLLLLAGGLVGLLLRRRLLPGLLFRLLTEQLALEQGGEGIRHPVVLLCQPAAGEGVEPLAWCAKVPAA